MTADDCKEGSCAFSAFLSILASTFFAAQVAGPVLMLTGFLMEDERLRDRPYDLEEEFTWTPKISPFAEGGLLLTWRF